MWASDEDEIASSLGGRSLLTKEEQALKRDRFRKSDLLLHIENPDTFDMSK